MRQRRDFDAHVHEYAALKIPALPFQDAKSVFCKFAQHQPSPSRCSGEFKEGDPTTISWWRWSFLTHKLPIWSLLNGICHYRKYLVEVAHFFVFCQNLSTRGDARIFRATEKETKLIPEFWRDQWYWAEKDIN